jgi:hypothetical protein
LPRPPRELAEVEDFVEWLGQAFFVTSGPSHAQAGEEGLVEKAAAGRPGRAERLGRVVEDLKCGADRGGSGGEVGLAALQLFGEFRSLCGDRSQPLVNCLWALRRRG